MSSSDAGSSLEETFREGSVKSHATLPDRSNSNQEILKGFTHSCEDEPNFIDDADKAYIILLNVFSFLCIKDLLAATQVCKVWNLVGSDCIFWKRISLNNCRVYDFDKFVQTLQKYQTEILDLRGLNFFKNIPLRNESFQCYNLLEFADLIQRPVKWTNFSKALIEVTTLTEITIEECSPEAITILAEGLPHLKSLSAYKIGTSQLYTFDSNDSLDITPIKKMRDLKVLRLESNNSKKLIFNESCYDLTENTSNLSLTTLTITRAINLCSIAHILPSTLVSLELDEYHSLSIDFSYIILPKLVNLTRLRLKKCYNRELTNMLFENIPKLPKLTELELINFEISTGMKNSIAAWTNLKSLLLIPVYRRESEYMHPMINTYILNGVLRLKKSLEVFVWVVTYQLISIPNVRKLKIRNEPAHVKVFGHGNHIPFLGRRRYGYGLDCISFDNVQNLFGTDVQSKIVLANITSTWKLSLQNIRM